MNPVSYTFFSALELYRTRAVKSADIERIGRNSEKITSVEKRLVIEFVFYVILLQQQQQQQQQLY